MKLQTLRWLVLATLIAGMPILAQEVGAPGCGDPGVKLDVTTHKGQKPPAPAAGKAMVILIQDDSEFNSRPRPTTRVGVDGHWVGATQGDSFMAFEVDPGVHHLCTWWQGFVGIGKGHAGKNAAHFTAEPGGVYYYELKEVFFMADGGRLLSTKLTALDSDEGQLLVNEYAMSVSAPKK